MIGLARARYFAVAIIVAAVLFFALGAAYWGGLHAWSECVYGKADCSLTVATYILCLVTAAAFVAAYAAAGWAYRTYELERAVVLAQRVCRAGHEDSIRFFLCDRDLRFKECDRLHESDGDFVPLDFEFDSLGRSAVVEGMLDVVCTIPTPATRRATDLVAPLNDIHMKSDGSLHVRVYLAPEVVNAGASVAFRVARRRPRVRRRRLELIPLGPQMAKYRSVVQLEEAAVAGIESTEATEDDGGASA